MTKKDIRWYGKAISWILVMSFLLIGGAVAVHAEALNWYCVRTKDHKQPQVDGSLSFIEDVGGYYIDHEHSSPTDEDKVLYLTFDVGYENGNVEKVLDAMKAEDVQGAFFILGHVAKSNADLIRRMADEGHLVCNHTYSHRSMVGWGHDQVAAELEKMEKACLDASGVTMARYFRPPEGKFDRALLEHVSVLGYKTVFWSFAYADWDNGHQPDPEKAYQKIMDNLHNGAIILLHPTSATNAAIMGRVIRSAKEQGYRFGSLDELTAGADAQTVESDIIYRKSGVEKKQIALTFDDGPHPRYTPMILDILKEYDVHATFFMVGENVKYYHEVAEAVEAAGHEIGNHTYSHARLDQMSREDIVRQICECEDEIASLHEYRAKFFRPPEGQLSSIVRQVSKEWDYRLVLWDVDTRDWAHTPPETICQKVLDTVQPGDIILMHDFIGRNSPTPDALRQLIPALLEEGYEFVTVGELIDGD